jgi:small nuclear ribonucleoprotein (snRNP)-like protein
VTLLVAPPHRSMRQNQGDVSSVSAVKKYDEKHYEEDGERLGSKVVDFTSPKFDALYALVVAPERSVITANPTILFTDATTLNTKLDNISKFRPLLPNCDPLRLDPIINNKSQKKHHVPKQPTAEEATKKKPPMFLAMASKYERKNSGPLSLLYSILANRQRVRVMVRYVDCVRGTLTGYLIAFDKHFNMILKDVDEVYSGRVTRNAEAVEFAGSTEQPTLKGSLLGTTNDEHDNYNSHHGPSKAVLESQRRKCYPTDGSGGPGPAVKQRYFHQLLVRGDNVVMVWRAESERSSHPRTSKSPSHSKYDEKAQKSSCMNGGGVGTPGSLYYALQRWDQNQKRPPR